MGRCYLKESLPDDNLSEESALRFPFEDLTRGGLSSHCGKVAAGTIGWNKEGVC